MNASNAKDYMPFVQALADKKTIQEMDKHGNFYDMTETDFRFGPQCYRVKPEPRRWWFAFEESNRVRVFESEALALDYLDGIGTKPIEVLEVLQ